MMDASLAAAIKICAAFLMGSIPFAKVAMIGTGIDITKVGSKNPGFNNVLRVSTKWRAAIALAGDVLKGFVALYFFSGAEASSSLMWAMGIAAVAGHCWSPFLGFNGGKGVATTVGVLLYLEWKITIPALILYPSLRWLGRRIGWRQEGAIASLTTMFTIATLVLVFRGVESGLLAYTLFAIVLVRHAPNIREIVS